jgi:hypothetical protein
MAEKQYIVCHAARRVAPFASMHLREKIDGIPPATLCGILARQDCPYFKAEHFGIVEPPFQRGDWCRDCARVARSAARRRVRRRRKAGDQAHSISSEMAGEVDQQMTKPATAAFAAGGQSPFP